MSERHKLAQCLCPERHCIMGIAVAAGKMSDSEIIDSLKAIVVMAIESTRPVDIEFLREMHLPLRLNPWCALCGALRSAWTYEVGPMRETNWDAAEREIRRLEQANKETADLLKRAGIAYDSRRN